MEIQIITLTAFLLSIFIMIKLRKYNIIFKKIIVEDKVETHLNKQLRIKDFRKVYKTDFKPYPMKFNSKLNKRVFEEFKKFYDYRKNENDYNHPSFLSMVFLNKVTGYIHDTISDSYELMVKKDNIPFVTNDMNHVEIIDSLLELSFNQYYEYDINGAFKLNGKTFFLRDLTSISICKNTIAEVDYSDVVFKFGAITQYIRFNSFKESFDYLFSNDDSDIRLIEKIANSSLIKETREV